MAKMNNDYVLCGATGNVYFIEYESGSSVYTALATIKRERADELEINYMKARMINVGWKKQKKILEIKW